MEYGCIGKTLKHSYSVEIHNLLGDYDYALKEMPPCEVGRFLMQKDFKGINVTIPYKETVIPYLDEIDPAAKAIGAVNTVINRDGRLSGYNTDYFGMKALIEKTGMNLKEKKVFILGTGGTSKTAWAVAEDLGAEKIIKVSRMPGGEDQIDYDALLKRCEEAEIIINTTPVGMYPNEDDMPVEPDYFPRLEGILDAVYHPLTTELVRRGMKRKIPAVGGLYMLVAQAARAAELFFGREDETGKIADVYRRMLSRKRNVVLIGMPGCGKSTQGELLARKLGMHFADSDEEIEKKIGEPVAAFLRREGEKAFREIESRIISELSEETGIIIATGGGVVTRPENIRALARNGKILFLDCLPERLQVTPDRPLTDSREALEKKYQERLPLYREAADEVIPADRTIEETAEEIERAIAEE